MGWFGCGQGGRQGTVGLLESVSHESVGKRGVEGRCLWRVTLFVRCCFFFSSRRRHTRCSRDWSSDVCSSDLAFDLFREARVEVAVLEVGLGGRLDATNVVEPIVTAITSIGLDHQAQLGESLESIAFEKAGIVKAGVPMITGDLPAAAERVIAGICLEHGAPLIPSSECRDLEHWIGTAPLALAGRHQRGNAAVAACVLRTAGRAGLTVSDNAIRAGLTEVVWPGRLERFTYGSAEVLLDAAHNPDGARALAAYLQESGWT